MTWIITHKPAYDDNFVELPKDLQKRATQAHADLEQDPVTPRGNTIKPLKAKDDLWRYRIGDHRIIYAVSREHKLVRLLAVGPRDSVYERFNYRPDYDEYPDVVFDPDVIADLEPGEPAAPEWTKHPEWFQPQPAKAPSNPLPQKLLPSRLERWQIPEEYHGQLMRCYTEADLATAGVPDDVLGRVMSILWPPSAEEIARQPDQMLFDPEDLERYAEGTLRGFLLKLDEHQQRYTDWALAGPTLVKGGPGSGKSTVALYRVRAIIERELEQAGQVPDVLFTTYTNALINFSESLLQQLLGDVLDQPGDELPDTVRVTNVDKIVWWITKSSGTRFDLARRHHQSEALTHARATLRPKKLGDLEHLLTSAALQNLRDQYLLDEFEWVIEGQNCRELDDYLNANRVGRGIPFNENLRTSVWALYTQYREHLAARDRRTWGQLRQLALAQVQSGAFDRRWDYVIVDEAQDLTPAALALCVELCRDPEGLFLTADANQSLYNRGFRWKNVHDQLQVVGRTRILRRNYRSTRELAVAANEILAASDGTDPEALQQDYVHTGPPPVIYAADGTADQARWLAREILNAARDLRLPVHGAAVLVPSNRLGRSLAKLLQERGLPARFLSSSDVRLEERCVKVLTLHAAKGLEFPIVAIANVEADRLPRDLPTEDSEELQEHLDNQRRLFFVGCTRAMRYLFVTHDRSLPSPFLEDLSDDRWLRL